MKKNTKKIGILTFHNSYNCGSMLETYAMLQMVKKFSDAQIINYSSKGQQELYSVFQKNNSLKKIIKNLLIFPHFKRVMLNNKKYEEFKNNFFQLSDVVNEERINDKNYYAVIAGSDQIWNVTIDDFNEVYLLGWVKNAKRIAYAPSFGAKNPMMYYKDKEYFIKMLKKFDSLSIREKNGQYWIKNMININVPILLDPTLLLDSSDYDKLIDKSFNPKHKYIFFYSPSFNRKICKYVYKIAKKYKLEVITWSTKSYYIKLIKQFGFILPPYESPSIYLNLIKNAELVITTSYHGTIFSTIYNKKFITVKNGGMYGDDDRVITLLEQLNMMERLIPYEFDDNFDYLAPIDYSNYNKSIKALKEKSIKYLQKSLEYSYEKRK